MFFVFPKLTIHVKYIFDSYIFLEISDKWDRDTCDHKWARRLVLLGIQEGKDSKTWRAKQCDNSKFDPMDPFKYDTAKCDPRTNIDVSMWD